MSLVAEMASYSHRRQEHNVSRGSNDNESRQNAFSRLSDTSVPETRKTDSSEMTSEETEKIRTSVFGKPPVSLRPKKPHSRDIGKTGSYGEESNVAGTRIQNTQGESQEHLMAVHDNPFIKEYGLEFAKHDQHEVKDTLVQTQKNSNGNRQNDTGETEQEYGVNSGFVNKLRSKFAKLETKQNLTSLSKRSASLENLLTVERRPHHGHSEHLGSVNRSSADDSKILSSNNAPSVKPVIKSDLKNNMARGSKPPIARKQLSSMDYLTRRQKRNSGEIISKEKSKPHPDHHQWTVAPDLEKVGRDNIVIIEAPKPAPETKVSKPVEDSETVDWKIKLKSFKDKEKETNENELPKPNTVSAFRSLFENVRQASESIAHWRSSSSSSPTRTVSDAQSPRVISPSPRSPLSKKSDDNVFEFSPSIAKTRAGKIDHKEEKSAEEKDIFSVSPTMKSKEISEIRQKQTPPVSPRDQEAVGKSVAGEFGVPFSSIGTTTSISRSPREKSPVSDTTFSQSKKKPGQSYSEIFDSKSIVHSTKERPKRTKPKKLREKSTSQSSIEDDNIVEPQAKDKVISPVSASDEKKTILSPSSEEAVKGAKPRENVSEEPVIRPSGQKPKLSPRGSKIFDSSDMIKDDSPPPKFSKPKIKPELKTQTIPVNTVSVEEKKTSGERNGGKARAPPPPTGHRVTVNGSDNELSVVLRPKHSNTSDTPKVVKDPPVSKGEPVNSAAEVDETKKPAGSENETAIRGRSSFLTNRMKNANLDSSSRQQQKIPFSQIANGSFPSPVPKKKQAPMAEEDKHRVNTDKSTPSAVKSASQQEVPRSSIDDIINRKKKTVGSAPVCVFDSSNIANKVKNPPKRKPPRKTIEQLNQNGGMQPIVPILDLSSLNDESSDYQEGYIPTVIKPCPFKFIGSEVVFDKSPMKKTRKTKVKISFDENATKTFEYEGEEEALEKYLQQHPEEREEVEKEEQEIAMDTRPDPDPEPVSPRKEKLDTVAMKTNTVLNHTAGDLVNYKARMQIDYTFGVRPDEPEESNDYDDNMPEEDSESNLHLRPADDSELDAFSSEVSSADLLF